MTTPPNWDAFFAATSHSSAALGGSSPPHDGGVLSGAGKTGGDRNVVLKTLVGVSFVDLSLLGMDGGVCGGLIGESRVKVCLVDHGACLTNAHRSPRGKGPPEGWVADGISKILVVVHASSTGDVGQVQPVVQADWLTSQETREWRDARIPPEVWTARFSEVRARSAGLEITDAHLRTSSGLHKTPMEVRPAPGRTSDTSPFEEVELPFSPIPALKTKPFTEDPLSDPSAVAEDLLMLHGTLGLFGTKLVQVMKESSEVRLRGTMVALKLNSVEAEVGDHPEVLSETTLWGGLGAVSDSIDDVRSLVKLMIQRVGASEALLQQHLDGFGPEQVQALIDRRCNQWMPPEVLARLASMAAASRLTATGTTSPRMVALEEEVAALRHEIQAVRGDLAPAHQQLIGSGLNVGAGGAKANQLQTLELRVDQLVKDQGLMRGMLDSTAITVSEQTVSSLPDTILLVERLILRNFPYLATTPMTLLEVAANDKESSFLQNRKNETSLGIQPLESSYFSAFRLECPTFFGDGKSSYVLSKVGSHLEWDNKSLLKPSVRTSITAKLKEAVKRIKPAIDQAALSMQAKDLLRTFLMSSLDFLTSFFQWISDFYELYHDQSSMSAEHVWELVQFLVRSVFADFRKLSIPVRDLSPGAACRDPNVTGRMFYMAFQCHKLASDYLDCEWDGHMTMAPAINKFLLRSVGMKDHIIAVQTLVEAKMADLQGEVKAAVAKSVAAQKAAQQAQSVSERGGGKGKGAGKHENEST